MGESETAYWAHQQPEDELSALVRASNLALLDLIEACCPDGGADVELHAASLSIRLGLSRGKVLQLCEIGLMLRRMPHVAALARDTAALGLPHLNIIANGTYGVLYEQLAHVDAEIVDLLTPVKRRQAMVGPRTLNNKIGDIVASYDDRARGDGTIRHVITSESVTLQTASGGEYSQIIATLRPDRAHLVMSAIEAASRKLTAEKHKEDKEAPEEGEKGGEVQKSGASRVPLPEALVKLVSQQVEAEVVLNIYRSPDSDDAWLDGADWLGALATEEWMREVTHLRLSGDSVSDGYQPTPAQTARVHGRDGTCRFPGCETPAHKCDLDHIKPYDAENPDNGGPTDTENLHCLCRRHHNLKTHKLYDVTAYADGTELWTSVDGTTAVSIPSGPMAGFGRQTFDQRMTRKLKARHKNYIDWLLSFSESTIFVFDEEDDEEGEGGQAH
nr:HNH endonuclease signature motif containing protein [Corynebacterium lactis]